MKESQWLSSEDPAAMLAYLFPARPGDAGLRPGFGPSDRKLRLWVCACVRTHDGALSEREARVMPQVERLADAGASPPDYAAVDELLLGTGLDWARRWAARGIRRGLDFRASLLREVVGNPFRAVARLVRSGTTLYRLDPVTPVVPLTPTVLSVARRAYEGRDFAGLPILADALEEAGCEHEAILGHLRGQERCWWCNDGKIQGAEGPMGETEWLDCECQETGGWVPLRGPHFCGCWALDLVLGKE